MKKDSNILLWVFFVSKGIIDNSDLMRCSMLCMQLIQLGDKATVKDVKNTSGYMACASDIPSELISNEKILEMINF